MQRADSCKPHSRPSIGGVSALLAESRRLRTPIVLLGLVSLTLVAARADATIYRHSTDQARTRDLAQLWPVELGRQQQVTPAILAGLHGQGINAVVIDRRHWTTNARHQLARAARAARLMLIVTRPAPQLAAERVSFTHTCGARGGTVRLCALSATTPAEARQLAGRGAADYVVVHISSPKQLPLLRPNTSRRTRIIAVLPPSAAHLDTAVLTEQAMQTAGADPATSLAVGPTSTSPPTLRPYLALLADVRKPVDRMTLAVDTSPPTNPAKLRLVQATTDSLSVVWTASKDNSGVAGYDVFLDGHAVGTPTDTSWTFSSLDCNTKHKIQVDAFDASGNTSATSTVTGKTLACSKLPADPTPTTTTVTTTTAAPTSDGGGGGGGGGGGTTTNTAPLDTAAPTTPAAFGLATVTATSAALAWNASVDDTAVAGYGVYNGGVLVGTTTSTNYGVSGLTCGTSYTFAVDAFDAAGNRSAKATTLVSTSTCPPAADTQAPTAPMNLVGSATTTTASLSWTASTDDVGVTGYSVYRSGSVIGSTSSTGYSISGLSCGNSYTFSVDAFDAAGNHSVKATVVVPTATCPPPADTQAPTAPTNLVGSATTTTASLSWTASTDNVGVTGYSVYQGSSVIGTTSTAGYSISGLSCGSSYTFSVDAFDAAGNRSGKTSVVVPTATCPPPSDAQAPTTPGALSATSTTTTSISLGWTASTDNVGVTGYGVYQASSLAATTTSTSYAVTGLTCGTSYSFAVDAVDAAGNRSAKQTASFSTLACPDTQPPSTPSALHSTGTTSTSISVGWTASTDNVGVSGYGVYSGSTLSGSTSSTSYTVSGLACGTSYTIGVDGYDAVGNRSAKATVTLSTATCPDTQAPTTPTGLRQTGNTASSVTVGWTASTDNVAVSGYGVYQSSSLAGSTPSTSYSISGLTCGTSYNISVDAFDAAGNRSGQTSTVSASTSACATGSGGVTTANIWISTGGGSCTRSGSLASYSASTACGSITAADAICRGGDIVGIKGGTYPQEANITSSGVSRSQTSVCTFANAQNEVATFNCGSTNNLDGAGVGGQSCLDIKGNYMVFDGSYGVACLSSTCMGIKTQTYTYNGYTYQGRLDADGQYITLNHIDAGAVADGGSNVTISHSDLGPSIDPYNNRCCGDNVTWSDNYFHDVQRESSGHIECFTDDGGLNQTIVRNLWKSCSTFSFFSKPVSNTSGSISNNAYWDPLGFSTTQDIAIRSGSGATSCAVTVSNNWTSNGLDLTSAPCPGATDGGGNTSHPATTQPPDPRQSG
jgi:chitodextrinase